MAASALIDGNCTLKGKLPPSAEPDDAWIDGARGLARATLIKAGVHWGFNDQNHVVERGPNPRILDERL